MLVMLDCGHGGIRNGKYTTCTEYNSDPLTWHKMWCHEGFTIYEGVFNRRLGYAIARLALEEGIETTFIAEGQEDISLAERVRRANEVYSKNPDAWLLSLHGNAFNTSAKGFEVYTSKGETPSDPIAEVIAQEVAKEFPSRVMRWDLTDGDRDKEANFYILKNTACPAVLSENFFFDQLKDAELMMSSEGVDRLAKAYVKAFKKIKDERE